MIKQGKRTLQALLNRLQGDQKARLLSASGKHGGAWVMCIPHHFSTRMDRQIFQFAVRHRLSLELWPVAPRTRRRLRCPRHNQEGVEVTDKHLLTCPLSAKSIRHTNVLQELRKIATECDAGPSEAINEIRPSTHWAVRTTTAPAPITTQEENQEDIEDGDRRPTESPTQVKGDMAFTNLKVGIFPCPQITDLTIVKEDSRSHTISQNLVGGGAREAEARKLKWYNDRFNFPASVMPVVPFVLETSGTFGIHACQLLTQLTSINYARPRPTQTTPAAAQDAPVLFANKDKLTPKGRRVRYQFIERLSTTVQIANYRMYCQSLDRHRTQAVGAPPSVSSLTLSMP